MPSGFVFACLIVLSLEFLHFGFLFCHCFIPFYGFWDDEHLSFVCLLRRTCICSLQKLIMVIISNSTKKPGKDIWANWVGSEILKIVSIFVCEGSFNQVVSDVGPASNFPLTGIRGFAVNMIGMRSFSINPCFLS